MSAAASSSSGVEMEELTRQDVVDDFVSYAFTRGLVMGNKQEEGIGANHVPLCNSLFAFPKTSFDLGVELSPLFNKLVDRVSRDIPYLTSVLAATGEADADFTGRLLAILAATSASTNPTQKLSLGLIRSDYMLHEKAQDPRTLLQVEINTISCGFAALGNKITEMHQLLSPSPDIPNNNALLGLAKAIALAHTEYIKQQQQLQPVVASSSTVVIMVVQPGERNFADQRHLHFALLETFGITCLRATLREIQNEAKLQDEATSSGQLLFRGHVVSVVYFRAGYSPEDHPSEAEWEARLLIEKSMAIKCPNIALHLTGSKKIQQALAEEGALERFLTPQECILMRQVFAGLYALDNISSENLAVLKERVYADSTGYVMKPQREGGGNNVYCQELVKCLRTLSDADLGAFILMERIKSPRQMASLVRSSRAHAEMCLSEIGIFGVYLSTADASAEFLVNNYEGYILRVKPEKTDEGGVASGYAVLGCPKLVY